MHENNVAVFVTVAAATRGGLVVQYEHLEGFIPISHLGQVGHMGGRACVFLDAACVGIYAGGHHTCVMCGSACLYV